MNQECISEKMTSKGQMTEDTTHVDIRWSLLWFACMDKDLENHFALI